MLYEPTALAAFAAVVAETLEKDYRLDATAAFQAADLDPSLLNVANARIPSRKMEALMMAAAQQSGDPCIGLAIGNNARATTFQAISIAWLASGTLVEALQRLCRYFRVVSTAPMRAELVDSRDRYILSIAHPDTRYQPATVTVDAGNMAFVKFCRMATSDDFHPASVSFIHDDLNQPARYVEAFGTTVDFGAERDAIYFDKTSVEAPIPGGNPDLSHAIDKVAERYIKTLEPHRVTSEVRKQLLEMLPHGHFDQRTIAGRLNRSVSLLKRQLQDEGVSFQAIREETRQTLAQEYVQEGKFSLGQIAFMLGYSDQSNFSRAFKRWTGLTPKKYQSQL
jgi:AraC-like DNA-binding protein